MRVIAQPMPANPSLPMNPTLSTDPNPTVVTTMVTIGPNASSKTSNCNHQIHTCDCIQFGSRQIQGNSLSSEKVQEGRRPLHPSGSNSLVEQQPKAAATATAPQNRKETPLAKYHANI